jgi:hypothetical protein
MANPIAAVASVVTNIGGGLLQRNTQRQAAAQSSDAQIQGAEAGMSELRSQFANLQQLLKPYVQAGEGAIAGLQPFAQAGAPALAQQQALIGLGGEGEQARAISALERSPLFQSQVRQGEEALLQQASATGGLRGGNVQAALAQFRPQMLQQQIDLQYQRLGGLTELGATTTQNLARMGQAAATGQAGAGMGLAESLSGLYGDVGASRAGRAMAEQRAQGQFQGGLINLAGQAIPSIGKLFSDIRLKENIKKIGTRPDGLGVYEFDYIWGGGRNIGLMAQEVNEVYPHAVGVEDGYLTVNYSQV